MSLGACFELVKTTSVISVGNDPQNNERRGPKATRGNTIPDAGCKPHRKAPRGPAVTFEYIGYHPMDFRVRVDSNVVRRSHGVVDAPTSHREILDRESHRRQGKHTYTYTYKFNIHKEMYFVFRVDKSGESSKSTKQIEARTEAAKNRREEISRSPRFWTGSTLGSSARPECEC